MLHLPEAKAESKIGVVVGEGVVGGVLGAVSVVVVVETGGSQSHMVLIKASMAIRRVRFEKRVSREFGPE